MSGQCRRAKKDFAPIVNASLTLLALIIGFTFSMAVSRYDQRKNYEEEEANAIGTEYVRVDFLPASDAASVRNLLQLRKLLIDLVELVGIEPTTSSLRTMRSPMLSPFEIMHIN